MNDEKKKSNRILQIVFLTIFMDLIGFGILIPIQPFLAEAFGASPKWVTLLSASYSGMQFLFAPFWGRLSDKIGRRPVMLTSIALGVVGSLLFGLAGTLPMLFAARMLAGFGNANIGAAQAIIADSTAPSERAKGMGLIGAAFGLGFIFGPALGGFFSQFGLAVPAFVAAGLSTVNFILAFVRLPETRPLNSPNAAPRARRALIGISIGDLRAAANLEHIKHVLFIFFMATAGFSLTEQVLGLFIERHWVPADLPNHAKEAARLTTYLLIAVGVTATVVQGGLIGRFAKIFGERKLLATGPLISALSFMGIILAGRLGSFPLLVAIGVGMAFGTGFTNPSLTSILSQLVGETDRGAVMGLGQSFSALGRAIGPALAGLLFEANPSLPMLTGGALMVTCTFVALMLPKTVGAPRVALGKVSRD